MLDVDSRDSVWGRVGVLLGDGEREGSAEPFATLDDLSIVGCRPCGQGEGRGTGARRGRGACQDDVLAGRRAAVRRNQVNHDGRADIQRGPPRRIVPAAVSRSCVATYRAVVVSLRNVVERETSCPQLPVPWRMRRIAGCRSIERCPLGARMRGGLLREMLTAWDDSSVGETNGRQCKRTRRRTCGRVEG